MFDAPKHHQLIILDFDRTLYDTSRLLQNLQQEFTARFGISPDNFLSGRNAARRHDAVGFDQFVADMPHADKVGMKEKGEYAIKVR